jgi:hypothetical protein
VKKVLQLLIILFAAYYLFQIVFSFYKETYETTYNVGDFTVKEAFKKDNYHFTFTSDKLNFDLQIGDKKYPKKEIVSDILSVESPNGICALPIFDEKVVVDAVCLYNNELTFYSNIKGLDNVLDSLFLENENYKFNDESDNKK